jgi:hypothetical protein
MLSFLMVGREDTIAMRITSVILVLAAGFASGTVLTGSYLYTTSSSASEPFSYTQIIKDITPQEAYSLIQKNRKNRHLAILDVRTPAEFKGRHIKGALKIDYHAQPLTESCKAWTIPRSISSIAARRGAAGLLWR